VVAPEDAAATLVLLHGRGHTPETMHALAERLDLADVACVTPAAPGGSWYPERFYVRRALNEPHLGAALATAHGALDELEARGVPAARIVLGGFSQGACVACDALASRPRPLGGLAVLCGGLVGADAGEWPRPAPGALAGLPVLLAGTERDEWVSPDRVRATAEILRAAGAAVDVRVSPPAPHEVHPEEVDALRQLVRTITAGRAAA
jgi:predicted esterase